MSRITVFPPLIWFFLLLAFISCKQEKEHPYARLNIEQYHRVADSRLRLNRTAITEEIDRLIRQDTDRMPADREVKRYYAQRHAPLWISRMGVTEQADTLLAWLENAEADGLNPRAFRREQIKKDLARIRSLDTAYTEPLSIVAARLEYNLTKAYIKYATGQRFGFVNPHRVFNRLDILKQEGSRVSYRKLFDLKMDLPSSEYYQKAFAAIAHRSVGQILRESTPQSTLYQRYKKHLPHTHGTARRLTLINMERSRWRTTDSPERHERYVLVNIPSYMLYAITPHDTLAMRMGCGKGETKTPILNSYIKRIDINPQWIIPRSIIEKEILRHADNHAYFEARRYFVRNKKTGEILPPTAEVLQDKDNMVIQRGGEGNALGRIIFRFDNNFSVYIHHTSSLGVFDKANRDVSHGCIRVEKPLELAAFVLGAGQENILDRMRYSMQADVSVLGKKRSELSTSQAFTADTLNRAKLISGTSIKQHVPLFIAYYTLLPTAQGFVAEKDVYGYDAVLWKYLKKIVR